MLVSRWWLIGVLALAAVAGAEVPADDLAIQYPDLDLDITKTRNKGYQQFDDEEEFDRFSVANVDDGISFEEEEFGRGIGKALGKGMIKGGKKVVSTVVKVGKKAIKISGKGLKLIGKQAGKGVKVIGKVAGKGVLKLAKGTGKGLMKGVKLSGKGLIKISKSAKNFATKKGKKIWGALREQWKGELGKQTKKLLKAVGKQILEVGVSIAVEAVAPMIVEYAMQATQDGLCTCEDFTCSCCAQPPGFEKGCLVMRVRPKLKFLNAAVTYAGKELAKINITSEEAPESCKKLDGLARFITACIEPLGMGEIENGFRGCLNINLQPIAIEREMCIDFVGNFKNGTAKWVPVQELDEVELTVEEAS